MVRIRKYVFNEILTLLKRGEIPLLEEVRYKVLLQYLWIATINDKKGYTQSKKEALDWVVFQLGKGAPKGITAALIRNDLFQSEDLNVRLERVQLKDLLNSLNAS